MSAARDVVIHTEGLTKRYGKEVLALDDLNLDVYRGEIFGYLGPNGAGKTTTIRLLLDFIRPTRGRATIFGLDAQAHSVALHSYLGNLPGELALWNHMDGWEVMAYLGGLRGDYDRAYVEQLAERLEMNMNRKVKDCSTGMKRKLGLIQALMHKPDLLILDEPTAGLDPLVQQTFYELMDEVRSEGRTVFLSSHNLVEVEHICDRVGILRKGRLEAVESISELKKVRFRWMTLKLAEHEQAHLGAFREIDGVSDIDSQDHTIRFRVTGEMDAVIKAAARHHVLDMRLEEPTLEEIFLTYYGEHEEA